MRIFGLAWSASRLSTAAAATLVLAGCAASNPSAGAESPAPRLSGSPVRPAKLTVPRYPVGVPGRQLLARHLLASSWRPAPGRPWSHRLLLAGTFTDVVSAGEVLYLLETLPHRAEPMQLLVRLDLRTGRVSYADRLVPVSGTAKVVVSQSGVWLLGWAWLSRNTERSGPLTLYRFDPQTLHLISRRQVGPAGCCEQATLTGWAGGRLWLSVGSELRLIRPAPFAVLQTVRIRAGPVQWLSFGPDLRRVYLAVDSARAGRSQQLQERTLPGWRLVHGRAVSDLLNLGPISAASDALWVVAGGGTSTQVQLLTADLSHVRLTLGAGELARGGEEKHFFSFGTVTATVLGGRTWLTASNALACLQPDAGRILAEQPGDQTRGPIITTAPVAVSGEIYGLGLTGLDQLQPPAACVP
jgi:hypothetical protein